MIQAITVFGLLLRLFLSGQSFWLDEAASIEIASTPINFFVAKMVTDFHPPLFYLLLKLWLPFASHSEWLIRLPFIILSTLIIPATYLLVLEVFQHKNIYAARLSTILLAISPFHIYYSQELRMYSLNALLTVLSWLFLIRYANRENKKDIFLFTVLNTLNIYTFYGAFFNLLAQSVWWLTTKKKILPLAISIAASFVLFLPWLPVLQKQLETGHYLQTALPQWKTLSGVLSAKSLALVPLKLLSGRLSFFPKPVYFLISGFVTCLYIVLAFLGKKEKRTNALLFWIVVPFILMALISLFTPTLGYWRFLFILPPILILTSAGLSRFSMGTGGIVVWLLIALTSFLVSVYWLIPTNQREDWQGLSEYLRKSDSLIILNYPTQFAPLKYYAPDLSYLYSQSSLGKPDDISKAIPQTVHKLMVVDYLSDLTDPGREAKKQIESLGFIQKTEKVFTNLGSVFEYNR